MAIDKLIYNNGINGLLSPWEIDSLPSDYEGLKSMFRDATARRMGTPPKVDEPNTMTMWQKFKKLWKKN